MFVLISAICYKSQNLNVMKLNNFKIFFGLSIAIMLLFNSCTKEEFTNTHAEEATMSGLYVQEIDDVMQFFETFQEADNVYNNYVQFFLNENNKLDYNDYWNQDVSIENTLSDNWDYHSRNRLKVARWADEQISSGKCVKLGKTEDGVYWGMVVDCPKN